MKYITPHITAYDSPYLSKNNTGLGNVLFQIASVYGISKQLGIECTFPRVKMFGEKLYNLFGYNHKDTIFRNVSSRNDVMFDIKIGEGGGHYNKNCNYSMINNINSMETNIIIEGYLEDDAYFKAYRKELVKMFSIDDNSLNYIKEKYKDLFFNDSITPICIHYRGNESKHFHNQHFKDYYKRAYNYIVERVTNPLFIIFTDDISCVDLSLFNNNYKIFTNDLDYIDLWCMSLCKHAILSNSTFTWWASYLNENPGKMVIYNKDLKYNYYSDLIGL